MTTPVNKLVSHPSFIPLIKFNSCIGRTFSPIPKTGKFAEILKRIAAIITAPLAYLVLTLTAIIGSPITKTKILKDCFEDCNDSTRFGKEDYNYVNWKEYEMDLDAASNCCSYPKLAVYISNKHNKNTNAVCRAINECPQKATLTARDVKVK